MSPYVEWCRFISTGSCKTLPYYPRWENTRLSKGSAFLTRAAATWAGVSLGLPGRGNTIRCIAQGLTGVALRKYLLAEPVQTLHSLSPDEKPTCVRTQGASEGTRCVGIVAVSVLVGCKGARCLGIVAVPVPVECYSNRLLSQSVRRDRAIKGVSVPAGAVKADARDEAFVRDSP